MCSKVLKVGPYLCIGGGFGANNHQRGRVIFVELKAVFWKVVVNGLWSTLVNANILVCSFGIVHALF